METKTIGINALISLGLISLVMIVPGFFEEPQYYCESRPEIGIVNCDSFSKYVSEVGKCIRDDNTNLICRDGWKLVIDDRLPEEIIDDNQKINKEGNRESYICYTGERGCELI